MLVLGIETSCDETGVAVYDSDRGLLAHALHSQVALHDPYGGVVPELASRDHVRRLLPLVRHFRFEAPERVPTDDAPLPGGLVDNSFALELWSGSYGSDDPVARLPFSVERLVWYGRRAVPLGSARRAGT